MPRPIYTNSAPYVWMVTNLEHVEVGHLLAPVVHLLDGQRTTRRSEKSGVGLQGRLPRITGVKLVEEGIS